ncbi:Hpt domain-containing protein [Kordia sp.]|uniref:Hpt domain-containing protein n=1 Tax=Kordia sp. TaxID=1965332 RepID=UPI003D2B6144
MAYNLEKILELGDGDQEFVEAVVVAFIEEIPSDLIQFTKVVDTENYKGIYQVSHKIKPNLDLLGMNDSYELNLQILAWSKAETNITDIRTVYAKVYSKITHNITALKKDFNL